jgi:hypothetical protein
VPFELIGTTTTDAYIVTAWLDTVHSNTDELLKAESLRDFGYRRSSPGQLKVTGRVDHEEHPIPEVLILSEWVVVIHFIQLYGH